LSTLCQKLGCAPAAKRAACYEFSREIPAKEKCFDEGTYNRE
jgi:hypothetical protein